MELGKQDLEDFSFRENINFLPKTFLEDKDYLILSKIAHIMRYGLDDDLHPSLLISLLRLPKEFKKIRSVSHLRRIICAEFFYKRKAIKAVDQYPRKRHLFVKIIKAKLEFPFGCKTVLGILVTFNLMKQREAFEEAQIIESVRNIIQRVHVVKGSFIENQDKKSQVHTVYLEIEREGQPEFTLAEIKILQGYLPYEFKGCIEELVPVTFMRRNEEEVYRNILALRDQLKSIKDIPQTTITFEEQTQLDLFFTVVLLRVIQKNTRSVQEILQIVHPSLIFILDRIDEVGTLRTQYKKEATVFRLQLPKCQFFRKDRSVNLYKARQKVLSMLVQALGPLRDYNGGLMLKQNERLEDFLSLMFKSYDEFFLENFFYSITPIAIQSILPAALIKEWFLAFSELFQKDLHRTEAYLFLCRKIDEAYLVIVRAEDSSFKQVLLKEITRLNIPSLELAFSEINIHGAFCFGFLYRPSLIINNLNFCAIVKDTMEKWSKKLSEEQTLRLAIQGCEPNLDPRISKEDQSYVIIKMLFDGLTRIGLDGKAELAIAEGYTASSDFKTYTFTLRESKWSNGTLITAYDFEYTWKNLLNPQSPTLFAHSLFIIKNARLAKENKISLEEVGIKATDEKTLHVELEYSAPYFLQVVAHWTFSLINSAIDQKYPGWAYQAGDTYVCNGPFKLTEWKHSRVITVEKNPNYWDAAAVKMKKISIMMIDRMQSGKEMLNKGEVDMIGRPLICYPLNGVQETSEDIEKVLYPLNGILLLCFNASQFPFNHKKIRKAFGYSINRERLQKLIPHDFAEESYTLLPNNLSFHSNHLFPNGDLHKARSLFNEGLGEIGFVKSDFPRLSLSFYHGHQRLAVMKMLCKQWKEAFGIDVHLKSLERDVHFDRLVKGKYQIGCMELNAKWEDPLHLLELFEDKNDRINISRWEHPIFQKLLRHAKECNAIVERDRFLKQAEAFLSQQMPAVPLYQISGNYFKKKTLKNIFAASTFQVDFKWAHK